MNQGIGSQICDLRFHFSCLAPIHLTLSSKPHPIISLIIEDSATPLLRRGGETLFNSNTDHGVRLLLIHYYLIGQCHCFSCFCYAIKSFHFYLSSIIYHSSSLFYLTASLPIGRQVRPAVFILFATSAGRDIACERLRTLRNEKNQGVGTTGEKKNYIFHTDIIETKIINNTMIARNASA